MSAFVGSSRVGSEIFVLQKAAHNQKTTCQSNLDYIPTRVYRCDGMKLHELRTVLEKNPNRLPRFVLPDGDYIPAHAHITEVSHVIRNLIDCGGVMGKEEKVLLQTHVGNDIHHRLRSDRLAKILQLGNKVVPNTDLDVDVEYDCCVVSQYPITEVTQTDDHLDIVLARRRTQCRPRERGKSAKLSACCAKAESCC
jgi:hypothetical protein